MTCFCWVACCEFAVSVMSDEKRRPPETVSEGRRAVSFAVSFSRHSVDLRVRCYDTDAQDLA